MLNEYPGFEYTDLYGAVHQLLSGAIELTEEHAAKIAEVLNVDTQELVNLYNPITLDQFIGGDVDDTIGSVIAEVRVTIPGGKTFDLQALLDENLVFSDGRVDTEGMAPGTLAVEIFGQNTQLSELLQFARSAAQQAAQKK